MINAYVLYDRKYAKQVQGRRNETRRRVCEDVRKDVAYRAAPGSNIPYDEKTV